MRFPPSLFKILIPLLSSAAIAQEDPDRVFPVPDTYRRDVAEQWSRNAPRIRIPVATPRGPYHQLALPAPVSLPLWGYPVRFYIWGDVGAQERLARTYLCGQSRAEVVQLADRRAKESHFYLKRHHRDLATGEAPEPLVHGEPGRLLEPGSEACENLRQRLLFAEWSGRARAEGATRARCAAEFARGEAEISLLELVARALGGTLGVAAPRCETAPPLERLGLLCALRHSNHPYEVWRGALAKADTPPGELRQAAAWALAREAVAVIAEHPEKHPGIDPARSIMAQFDRVEAAAWPRLAGCIARRIFDSHHPLLARIVDEPVRFPLDFPLGFKRTAARLPQPEEPGLKFFVSEKGVLKCTAGLLAPYHDGVSIDSGAPRPRLRLAGDGVIAAFFRGPEKAPTRARLTLRHGLSSKRARALITGTWGKTVAAEHLCSSVDGDVALETFDLGKIVQPRATNYVVLSLDPRHAGAEAYVIESLEVTLE